MRLRTVHRLLPVVLLLALLMPPSAGADCTASSAEPTPDTLRQTRHAVRCLLNEFRAGHDLPLLRGDRLLRRAAMAQTHNMIRRHYFDHTSPGGGTIVTRAYRVGYL